MAYNNRNTLQRMVEIQNLVLERKRRGITQKHVYETEVFPKYLISYATFNRYLAYPAKHELKFGKKKDEKRALNIRNTPPASDPSTDRLQVDHCGKQSVICI